MATELPPAPPHGADDRALMEWWKAAAQKYDEDRDELMDKLEETTTALGQCQERAARWHRRVTELQARLSEHGL